MALTAEQEARARDLWENSDRTASQIGVLLGTTRNAIIGLSRRRKWKERRPDQSRWVDDGRPIPTLFDRMDALHAEMDRVLRETEPAIRASHALRLGG